MWSEKANSKIDLSMASRFPNPDEQYLNGTSPTFPVYGLGQPTLGKETTYGAAVTTALHNGWIVAELSLYGNFIDDYIYFAPEIGPDGLPVLDVLSRGVFPRFRTRPIDAVFYGFDGGLAVTPIRELELSGQVSVVRARNQDDDSYLVFVPADQARLAVTLRPADVAGFSNVFVSLAATGVRRQDRFDINADFVPPPPGYVLLGAELGAEKKMGQQVFKFSIEGKNLLGTRYRDYTSLDRYFADEPGWALLFRMSLSFSTTPT
jgi:iron complex outermembrane receptor protein